MIDLTKEEIPKFAFIITIALGCIDLIRGFIHTILLEYAAEFIMGLDLTVARDNQLLLLGVFGISNYITGIFMILIALKARDLVPYALIVIPICYFFGMIAISRVATPQAALGGMPYMLVYFIISIITSIASFVVIYYKRKNQKT